MFGDDTARYPFLLEASLSPYAADAIRYALETAADSGRIEGIDMVDCPHIIVSTTIANPPTALASSNVSSRQVLGALAHYVGIRWDGMGIV